MAADINHIVQTPHYDCKPIQFHLSELLGIEYVLSNNLITHRIPSLNKFWKLKTIQVYNTRQLSDITVLLMHRKLTHSTYLYIGPKIYNMLPSDIKTNQSFYILKIKITNRLQNK